MPEQFIPHQKNPQVIRTVALSKNGRYSLAVAANSATGLGNPTKSRRNSAPLRLQALFLCPQLRVMAAVRGRHSCLPGSLIPGLPTCVQLPPIRLVTNVAAPQIKELHR